MEKKEELQTTLIEVDARVSYSCVFNTVKINIKREKKELLMRRQDGNLVVIESTKATPFSIPNLLLNNISSFEPNNIFSLLYSTLDNIMLCDSLTTHIVYQAKKASGQGPIHISIDVSLTPQTISGESDFTCEMETCAICLEEAPDLCNLSCSHTFHNDCIGEWLCESNTCPICRTIIEDDDDDHSYYSD